MDSYKDQAIAKIRKQIGDKKVICGLSGGVDSSVTAILIHEAIGDQLTCVYVDNGLMRKGETEEVLSMFRENYNIPDRKSTRLNSSHVVISYAVFCLKKKKKTKKKK